MAADPFNELIHRLRGELLSEMPAAQIVLSAGCAGSWYFQWFGERYPHRIARHIGFDLERPPEDLPPEVEWHQSSFADLSPVPDHSVDLIFAGQAIEHVSTADCFSFLQHAHRVLADQGWLVMDSPNFSITGPALYLHPEHVIEYSPEQMEAVLKAAGFRAMNRKGILLCKRNGKLLDDPLAYNRIDEWRTAAAKDRPQDSFIWWIEARPGGRFDADRLASLLSSIASAYKRQRAQFAQKKPSERPVRQVIRRLMPRRLRWLVRAGFRLITGFYLRLAIQHVRAIRDQLANQSAQIEAQAEVMELILRRLHVAQDEMTAQLRSVDERLASVQPLTTELSARTVAPLNFDHSHRGFRAHFGLWINDPIVLEYTPEEVRWALTNERVVEVPFTLQAISLLAPPARIIDVGAQESLIALQLASLGYRVTALDIRPYTFAHPNLTVIKGSILDAIDHGEPYDAAILLSALEHFGLPVYGETKVEEDADERAMERVRSLLRPGGLLVLTTPFGPPHIEETQRIYSAADLARLLEGFRVRRCLLATHQDQKTWVVDNDIEFESLAGMEDSDERAKVALISAERV